MASTVALLKKKMCASSADSQHLWETVENAGIHKYYSLWSYLLPMAQEQRGTGQRPGKVPDGVLSLLSPSQDAVTFPSS